MRSISRSKNGARVATSGYDCCRSEVPTVVTPPGWMPKSTASMRNALIVMSNAPVSSVSETATSRPIRIERARDRPPEMVAPRPPAAIDEARLCRHNPIAGTSENARVDTRPPAIAIAASCGSNAIAVAPPGMRRSRKPSTNGTSHCSATIASATPVVVAATPSQSASATSMRSTCARLAPSATRSTTSRSRRWLRTSISTATFAHAITRTNAAAAPIAHTTGRTDVTYPD